MHPLRRVSAQADGRAVDYWLRRDVSAMCSANFLSIRGGESL